MGQALGPEANAGHAVGRAPAINRLAEHHLIVGDQRMTSLEHGGREGGFTRALVANPGKRLPADAGRVAVQDKASRQAQGHGDQVAEQVGGQDPVEALKPRAVGIPPNQFPGDRLLPNRRRSGGMERAAP